MKGQADSSRLWTWPRLRDSPDPHASLGPNPAVFDDTGIFYYNDRIAQARDGEKSIRSSRLFGARVGLFLTAHFVTVLLLHLLNIWNIKTFIGAGTVRIRC